MEDSFLCNWRWKSGYLESIEKHSTEKKQNSTKFIQLVITKQIQRSKYSVDEVIKLMKHSKEKRQSFDKGTQGKTSYH